MAGRKYAAGSGSKYRYGFNGKELDSEAAGTSTYDYGFRIYNPALGRFLSVDPLSESYPWYTPYQFAGNTPVWCIDLDGLEPVTIHSLTPTEYRPKLTPSEWYVIMLKGGQKITEQKSFEAAARNNLTHGNTSVYTSISQRHEVYGWAHSQLVSKDIYWFGAAYEVTSLTAIGASDESVPNLWVISDDAEDFMQAANKHLFEFNTKMYKDMILDGKRTEELSKLIGVQLDNKMVEIEQKELSKFINNYFVDFKVKENKDYSAWKNMINNVNDLFNGEYVGSSLGNFFNNSAVKYGIDEFKKQYGKDAKIDFEKESDRVFLGEKMVEYLRNQPKEDD